VDCNNLTDVEKVVSKGIEEKKARRENLTEDDERMNRILTEKKSAAKRASVASVVTRSSFMSRTQPLDTYLAIVEGSLVPWSHRRTRTALVTHDPNPDIQGNTVIDSNQ
jgi:hypothetical protein